MKRKSLVVVALMLVLALSLSACGASGAQGVAEGFLNAMKDGDGEKMASFCVEELKTEVEGVGAAIALAKAAGSDFKMSFSDMKVEEDGDTATATFKIKSEMAGDVNEEEGGLSLKKVDGKWLVSGIIN